MSRSETAALTSRVSLSDAGLHGEFRNAGGDSLKATDGGAAPTGERVDFGRVLPELEESEGGCEEGAALTGLGHSITRSARSRSDGGIVRPSILAVLRLMISSNLLGCSTGKSPGLTPLRILSTNVAARRSRSRRFAP